MPERKSQQELDFERKHEEDLQRLRGLRLIDDDFMAAVFEERACAEFLLQIILKRDDLTVKEVHGQYSIKNLQGRSVRLDILAVDRENRAYNIEVQRSDRGASEKRARYNSSLLDANLTDAGDDYDALNETYVIFITENDVLKAGLPIYHVDRTIRETGTFFNKLTNQGRNRIRKTDARLFLYQLEGYELFHFGTEGSLFQRRHEGSGSYVQSYGKDAG